MKKSTVMFVYLFKYIQWFGFLTSAPFSYYGTVSASVYRFGPLILFRTKMKRVGLTCVIYELSDKTSIIVCGLKTPKVHKNFKGNRHHSAFRGFKEHFAKHWPCLCYAKLNGTSDSMLKYDCRLDVSQVNKTHLQAT